MINFIQFLKEDPDELMIPMGAHKTILHYEDPDAFAFAIFDNYCIITNGNVPHHEIYDILTDKTMNDRYKMEYITRKFIILGNLDTFLTDFNSRLNEFRRIYSNTAIEMAAYKEGANLIRAGVFDITGRLWINNKICSFWNPVGQCKRFMTQIKAVIDRIDRSNINKYSFEFIGMTGQLMTMDQFTGHKSAIETEQEKERIKELQKKQHLDPVAKKQLLNVGQGFAGSMAAQQAAVRGGFNSPAERAFRQVIGDSVEIIKEDPDFSAYNGELLRYDYKDARSFLINKHNRTMILGDDNTTHTNLAREHNIVWSGGEAAPYISGRLWLKSNRISLWSTEFDVKNYISDIIKIVKKYKLVPEKCTYELFGDDSALEEGNSVILTYPEFLNLRTSKLSLSKEAQRRLELRQKQHLDANAKKELADLEQAVTSSMSAGLKAQKGGFNSVAQMYQQQTTGG